MIIEGTTRCTLACPGCPRTQFSEKFNRPFPKQDLDIDTLVRFLDCDAGLSVKKFMFNGNHGDPIYYPNLIPLLHKFRDTKTFAMSTNGSFQTSEFWHQLADVLGPEDTVFFSIDGLEHNNHFYRRNANWKSIMSGIEIMKKSRARLVWKTLVFAYNEHEIDQIKKYATDLGLEFVFDYTNRFGDNALVPTKIDHDREYTPDQEPALSPRCLESEYISADGYYWPCCMISSMFTLHKTPLWQQREQWRIDTQTLDQARAQLLKFRQSVLDDPKSAHSVCKMHCKTNQVDYQWTRLDK